MSTLLKTSLHEMLSYTQLCANEDLPPMPKNWQAWRGWKAPGEKGGEGGGWRVEVEVEGRYDRRHGLPYLPPRGLTSASVGRHFFLARK